VDRTLLILNDPPYGSERSYNGLRLASALAKRERNEVRVFLMGDAVACAKAGQKTPNGYYNLERMIAAAVRNGVEIGCCGTCLDARGIGEQELVESAHRSTMEELADWSGWAAKIVVF
jgi:uncharacterized protein involved in oxidation of intracellular sulfur